MVRFNLLDVRSLTDEHLRAEYVEMLMFSKSSKKFKGEIPKNYRLGKGHQLFFKDKGLYVERRFNDLKAEMRRRGFKAVKEIDIGHLFKGDFKPNRADLSTIKERIKDKILLKPNYYHFEGKKINAEDYLKELEFKTIN